jgi:hypothetical protein
MKRPRLPCAALLALALPLAGAGCGAGAASPAPVTAKVETSSVVMEPSEPSEPVDLRPDGQPAPLSPAFLREAEAASQRSDAATAAAAAANSSWSDSEEGRPVSSGTCVGRPSKAVQKKVKGPAMCCYIPPAYFQKRIREKNDAFRACYNDALKRRPDLHGRIVTKFNIEEDGSVAGVCDAGSTVGDPPMVACVLRAFTTVTFEAYSVGDPCPAVTVNYPLQFSPDR